MISEAKVREIHQATSLTKYSYEELREADQWVKSYALLKLSARIVGKMSDANSKFILLMAHRHYHSVETDEFLQANECYPSWMERSHV